MVDYTPSTFAAAVLQRMGLPVTAANMQAMTAWEKAEGGNWNNSAKFNPLNTTENMPGSTTMNSVGVRVYTSWQQGLDATIKTLQNGHYGGILSALKAGSNAQSVANAVGASPWGTGAFSVNIGDSSVPSQSQVQQSQVAQSQTATGSDFFTSSGASTGNAPMSVEQAISQYGFVGTLADTVPELKNILVQAAQGDWPVDQFTKKVQDTTWWKTHNQTARENQALKATDPAEYKLKFGTAQDHVSSLVAQSGLQLHSSEMKLLTGLAFNQGYSDEQINEFLAAHGRMGSGGLAGQYTTQLKEAAANYGVSFSRDGIDSAVRHIVAGRATVDDFTNNFMSQAEKAFPTWGKQIAAGQTTRQLADPYIQTMSQILEVPSTKIDLYDPTIRKAMQSTDPEANSPSTLPMWKFEQQLRSDPRWDKTQNAADAAYQVVHQIGNNWGFST